MTFEVGELVKYIDAERPEWLAVVVGTGKSWDFDKRPMVYIHWITGTLADSEYESNNWFPAYLFEKVSNDV